MPGARAPSAYFFLLGACVFAFWVLGTSLLIWVMLVAPNQTVQAPHRDVVIERTPGGDVEGLAEQLATLGVIQRPRAFAVYLRLLGVDTRLRSKFVVVNRALSTRDLLPRLVHGFGGARVRVPIPEGFTRFDVAIRLERFGICEASAFERITRDPPLLRQLRLPFESAEGYLFPATYELMQSTEPYEVMAEMVRVFRVRTRTMMEAYEREHDGAPFSLTQHELVTLASVVEREARRAEERPTIAGVFMNRLTSPEFRPKRLQADPTVAYGCLVEPALIPSCSEFDGRRITPAMVRDPRNRYSTYRNDGLPPGPISNPGLSALEAALHPEQHPYFYFVTRGGGYHAFSRDLAEHNARVRGEPP